MPKPTEADKERFRSLAPEEPGVEVRPMFGNLGAFVHGNMFMGLFGADVGLKLAGPDREALTAVGGGPFGPPERPMGGYVTLPAAWSVEESETWVGRALSLAAALPPKEKKPKKT